MSYMNTGTGTVASIMIHVDDGIVLAENTDDLHYLLERLDRSFDGKFTHTLGKVHKYLGMCITMLLLT
jgi:hypothetical protein